MQQLTKKIQNESQQNTQRVGHNNSWLFVKLQHWTLKATTSVENTQQLYQHRADRQADRETSGNYALHFMHR